MYFMDGPYTHTQIKYVFILHNAEDQIRQKHKMHQVLQAQVATPSLFLFW